MKTFSVAVAVAVVLTVLLIQESSATPIEVQQLEEAMSNDNPAAEHQETSEDSWMMPYNRHKRGIKCRFCCDCCQPGVCGICCNHRF